MSRRRRNFREPYKTIVIICEGKTEKIYFENFKKRGINIEIPKTKHTDARSLIDFAKQLTDNKNPFSKYDLDFKDGDQLWCVFDIEGNTEEQLQEVRAKAPKNKTLIAASNPCFEFWYLLHFELSENHISTKKTIDRLKRHVPDYSKTHCIYHKLGDCIEDAKSRAKRLKEMHERNGLHVFCCTYSNPSTDVYKLVESLT